jgi:predicted metal-dependent peptidase
MAHPGRAISRDISRGEAVESEINSFITKRHNDRAARGEGERLAEEARRRVEEEHARLAWAKHLRAVYARRKEEYERLVERLEGTDREETP